ncbi:cysteine hydrolase family protein [Pseudomonas benzenivorans]|uniref:cysteine hydrolase family protein n=1 Tax=Pseudomonas benzenivorans TaxID=556533 RepID=UPI003512D2F5
MKQALLIVDVQAGLFLADPPPYQAEAVLERINDLAGRARAAAVPVLYIQHDGEPGSLLEPDSLGWQLHPGLQRGAGDWLVHKTASDAFQGTELAPLLRRLGVEELFVSGYATEFCIDTLVRRAASEGFAVRLVGDAHTTKDRPVLSAEQIIAHHNWLLAQLIQPQRPVQVLSAQQVQFSA